MTTHLLLIRKLREETKEKFCTGCPSPNGGAVLQKRVLY
jgi:hypothetical protein